MAKPWREVVASPQYQALSPDQQAAAQQQYFDTQIAPQVGADVDVARQQFFTQYPPATAQAQQNAPQQAQQQNAAPVQQQQQIAPQQAAQAQQQAQPAQQQDPSLLAQTGQGVAEAGRAILQAGADTLNILPAGADAVQSAAAWLGNKIGIGDGTYQPLPRLELPQWAQPQTQAGQIAAEAIPYLVNPASGAMRGAGLAERAGALVAENGVGALANNSGQNDTAGDLTTDLATGAATSGAIRGLASGAGAIYRGIRGAPTGEASDLARFAQENDVPLYTTDVQQPGTFLGRSAQAAGEKIPLVGTGAQRRAQQEARSQLVRDYTSRFGEPTPGEVYNSLQQKGSTIKKAAGNRLNRIVDRMDSTYAYIPANRTAAQLDVEIGRLRQLGEAADTTTINKLEAYQRELNTNRPTFSQMQNLRSQFRQDVRGERTSWPSSAQAAVERVYKAMGGDLTGAVARDLGPEEARRFQQANSIYAREAENVNRTRLKNVLQKGDITPEVVNNLLFSNKPSEVKALYQSLDNRGRAAARNSIIGKALEKAGDSPDKFLNAVNRLSTQTGIFFKGEDRRYLQGLTKYLDATRRASVAGAVTPTGQEVLQFALPAGIATDIATNGGAATLGGASYGLLTRMYESRPIRNAIMKMAGTPAGSTAFERHLDTINSALIPLAQGTRQQQMNQ